MLNNKNFQQAAVSSLIVVIALMFNACGDPLKNKVNIEADPNRPEVSLIDVPEPSSDGEEEDTFVPGLAALTAPWFQYDYVINNSSDRTFYLTSLEFLVSGTGQNTGSASATFTVSDLEEEEISEDYPFAVAIVEAGKQWKSTLNSGLPYDPDTTDSDDSLTARIPRVLRIGSLPTLNRFGVQESTVFEVEVRATGYFGPSEDDDNEITYERSFRFFTE